MTPEDIDELVEAESESLLSHVSRWGGLADQLAEMRRLIERHGPALIPHLPWERASEVESAVVAAWIEVHVQQADNDPEDQLLLAALADRISSDARFGSLALSLFGRRAASLVLPLAQRLEPGDTRGKARTLGLTTLYWGLQRWSLPEVVRRASNLGLSLEASEIEFDNLANHEGADSAEPVLFLRALAEAGHAVLFDAEQGGDYDQLLRLFTSLSGEVFAPDNATQSERQPGSAGEEVRTLTWAWNGETHSLTLPYQGDVVDASTLTRGLNRILAGAGKEQRWFQALDGDRCCILFTDLSTALAMADTLLLFLDDGDVLSSGHSRLKARLLEALGAGAT